MIRAVPPGRDAFGDPATGEVYLWPHNHSEEQGAVRTRAVNAVMPSAARFRQTRAIRVQSTPVELVYRLAGSVLTRAQHNDFLRFVDISTHHTIYFYHFAGDLFECFLSDYEPQRKYLQRGPRGEHYVWPYTMQIDVITKLS